MSHDPPNEGPRYGYEGVDQLIHERARLRILTGLMAHPKGLLFAELKELCGFTDGNLNRHLHMLEKAGVVEVWKGYKGRKPQTLCRVTDEGRRRFNEYLRVLEHVIADAAAAARADEEANPGPGWLPA